MPKYHGKDYYGGQKGSTWQHVNCPVDLEHRTRDMVHWPRMVYHAVRIIQDGLALEIDLRCLACNAIKTTILWLQADKRRNGYLTPAHTLADLQQEELCDAPTA